MNKFLDLMVENACEEIIKEQGYDLSIVTDSQIASYLRIYDSDIAKDSLDEVTQAVKRFRKRNKGFQK